MTEWTPVIFGALLAWGTLAGIDLVSFPQALFSRPLVAGAGAGFLLGDLETGLRVGAVLELFALDVLPVGASRYPDYGAGVVGAVVLTAGTPWPLTLGLATGFGLVFAVLGGWSLQLLRTANGRMIQRAAAGLAAGDAGTIARVQLRGLLADALRGALLTALALLLAVGLRPLLPASPRFELVTAVAVGVGLTAVLGGAIRSAGRSARLRWLGAGAGAGLLLALIA